LTRLPDLSPADGVAGVARAVPGDALLIFGIKMPKTGGLYFSVLLLHAFFPVGKSMKPQCLVMDYFVTGWFETIF
jgi:hypothetical protein